MRYKAYIRIHNLKSNYDKFLPIVKETLKDIMLPDGHFQPYKNKPQLSTIEIVTLAVLAENHLFSKPKTE